MFLSLPLDFILNYVQAVNGEALAPIWRNIPVSTSWLYNNFKNIFGPNNSQIINSYSCEFFRNLCFSWKIDVSKNQVGWDYLWVCHSENENNINRTRPGSTKPTKSHQMKSFSARKPNFGHKLMLESNIYSWIFCQKSPPWPQPSLLMCCQFGMFKILKCWKYIPLFWHITSINF